MSELSMEMQIETRVGMMKRDGEIEGGGRENGK
jgi:hypothetical protein